MPRTLDDFAKAKSHEFMRLRQAMWGPDVDHRALMKDAREYFGNTADLTNVYGARRTHARDKSVFSFEAMKARREAKAARIKPAAGGQEKKSEA